MLKIESINDRTDAKLLVRKFLANAGTSLHTFRYFDMKNVGEILKNHLITLLAYDGDGANPLAYGHLDNNEGIVWLGICVVDKYIGAGIGKEIMKTLLNFADSNKIPEVLLSVDIDNLRAIKLYENFEFVSYSVMSSKNKIFMKRKGSHVADTFGSLIDKLATVNQKMFINQELLYEIRRMTFDEYKIKYFASEEGALKLWSTLKKACDLNVQRSSLIHEIDEKVMNLVEELASGKDVNKDSLLQQAHKTY